MQKRKTIFGLTILQQQVARLCLYLIKLYQTFVSPLKPRTCRFYPTCSQYCYEAIQAKGLLGGIMMGIKRITCCHPFHPGGYDPVQ